MRLTKKWRVVLIICVAAIAIPIAAHVSPTQTEFVEPAQVNLYQPIAANTEVAKTTHRTKIGISRPITLPQAYYNRRRAYFEQRVEGRANNLEEEDGDDDDDAADNDDGNDSEDSASDDDEGDSMDNEEEVVERRREYLRDRLERRWN